MAPAEPRTALATPLPVEPSPNALRSASRSGVFSSSVTEAASCSAAFTNPAAALSAVPRLVIRAGMRSTSARR
jgi:hypothetical protein